MNRVEVKEKIVSSRPFQLSKSTLKFFIWPITVITAIFAFRFYKFIHTHLRPPKVSVDKTPQDFGLDYEEVVFRAETPMKISGWFIPAREKPLIGKPPTIIFCHGWPANRLEVLNRVEILPPRYNFFLFDFRALGESAGPFSSFGFSEQQDLIAAIEYLKTRQDVDSNKLGLFGFSMGGAVSLMVANKFPEIKAIVVESPYAKSDAIIQSVFGKKSAWSYLMVNLAVLLAHLLVRIDSRKISPLEAVKQINVPLFIIHGRDDAQIPFGQSQMIFEAANEPKFLWAPSGSGHGQVINDYRLEYKERIGEFFGKYLL